ncbi:MAG: membrane-bound lytic murein transglycosylase D [Bradymonadia bacterium]|jgi:membrane-bound lytic murein transglycosylase D
MRVRHSHVLRLTGLLLTTLLWVVHPTDGQAQQVSLDEEFFQLETLRTSGEVPWEPAGFGPDAEYDGIDRAPRRPGPITVPALSFDLDAIVNLPFELERLDDPNLLHFLEFYSTEGRSRMTSWLSGGGRFREHIEPILAAEGAPLELLWVVAVESGFDPFAESNASAVGLWQFRPRTGRSFGLRIDGTLDERRCPTRATQAAARYYNELHEMFGSWMLAFAGYNAGHGHVRGELRDANATDFWEMDESGTLYANARRYAMRILTIAIFDQNRAAFGFEELIDPEPWRFDTVDVPGNIRLSLLGEALGMSAEELRQYNPELAGLRTPSDTDLWPLRIPEGARDQFVASYDRLSSRYGEGHELIVLRFGETVEDIGERFDIPGRVLRSINGIAYGAASPYLTEVMVPFRGRDEVDPADPPEFVLVPEPRFDFVDRRQIFYETRRGDDLATISHHFDVPVEHLAAWNDLDVRGALVSGLTLQVFVDPERDLSDTIHWAVDQAIAVHLNSPEHAALMEVQEEESESRQRAYTVRSGDTVMAIAARFGVRSRDIVRWNNLSDSAMIIVGQELVVRR